MFSTSPTYHIVSIGVHLCVQYLQYISDEYQIMDGDKTP